MSVDDQVAAPPCRGDGLARACGIGATVGRLLRENGFSPQGNAKTLDGEQRPDRDAQFCYINEQVKDHQYDGEPVTSVDTKKREQLGRLPMGGREWHPKQAIPYRIYDITHNTVWVNVGVDHDTSVFAVEPIRRWWMARGSLAYPNASRLLIRADAGQQRLVCQPTPARMHQPRVAPPAARRSPSPAFQPGRSRDDAGDGHDPDVGWVHRRGCRR